MNLKAQKGKQSWLKIAALNLCSTRLWMENRLIQSCILELPRSLRIRQTQPSWWRKAAACFNGMRGVGRAGVSFFPCRSRTIICAPGIVCTSELAQWKPRQTLGCCCCYQVSSAASKNQMFWRGAGRAYVIKPIHDTSQGQVSDPRSIPLFRLNDE